MKKLRVNWEDGPPYPRACRFGSEFGFCVAANRCANCREIFRNTTYTHRLSSSDSTHANLICNASGPRDFRATRAAGARLTVRTTTPTPDPASPAIPLTNAHSKASLVGCRQDGSCDSLIDVSRHMGPCRSVLLHRRPQSPDGYGSSVFAPPRYWSARKCALPRPCTTISACAEASSEGAAAGEAPKSATPFFGSSTAWRMLGIFASAPHHESHNSTPPVRVCAKTVRTRGHAKPSLLSVVQPSSRLAALGCVTSWHPPIHISAHRGGW